MKTLFFYRSTKVAYFFFILILLKVNCFSQEEQKVIASNHNANPINSLNSSHSENKELVFISDIQSPIFIEKILRSSEKNDEATDAMLSDMLSRSPEAVFMLGDNIRLGFLNSEWATIDKFQSQMHNRNTGVFAVPGNHEYMLFASRGIQNYCKRFSVQSLTGYVIVKDSIAVVMLNSNFSKMSREQINIQSSWYSDILDKLDRADSIKSILVCCHHSPFTRSMIVGSSKEVQKIFLDKFEKSTKARLFLSGHSHNLEHYTRQGKYYIVIGGGGGPSQPLFDTLKSSPTELKTKADARFFYLIVERQGNELKCIVRSYDSYTSSIAEFELK